MSLSNARRISLCFFLALNLAAQRPRFAGREVLPAEAAPDPQVEQALDNAYTALRPERSLLINDCTSGWCTKAPVSWDKVLDRAGAASGLKSGLARARWLQSAKQVIPSFDPARAKFQTLAIVNRLDLAEWDAVSRKWKHAEFRLVFGQVDKNAADVPDFNAILEFALPDLTWNQFQALAVKWKELSAKSCDGSKFNNCLLDLTQSNLALPIEFVRLRTNSRLGGNSTWQMSQWEFQKGQGLEQASLNDQIRLTCVNGQESCEAYSEIWTKFPAAGNTPRWPIGDSLLTKTQNYSSGKLGGTYLGMNTPKGLCQPNLQARNVLSLQECSFCHGGETNNEFRHVANREPKQKVAPLSAFLRGQILKPSYRQLAQRDPQALHVANVAFITYSPDESGNCVVEKRQEVQRFFHDLGRRSLFLAAVLIAPGDELPPENLKLIQSYQPDSSH